MRDHSMYSTTPAVIFYKSGDSRHIAYEIARQKLAESQYFLTECILYLGSIKIYDKTEDLSTIEATFEDISHKTVPGYFEPVLDAEVLEPLKRFPRVMHPHRFNETAKNYMLHQPILDVLGDLYGEEAYAAKDT